ncbi:hypothetical protein Syun_009227 [Stephania yunnanensis]|uniref:HTH myb-type domain-containing protein n=1 Tax=Stephania yunnanensis TaxID=152371 RepID=A0AAP0KFS1_9MAGN
MFHSKKPNTTTTSMNSSSHERSSNPMCVQPGDSALVLTTDPKLRLRWTVELHERFVDAVTQLGGPDKATPKMIMHVMGVRGLTLYHLKSHLQVQKHLQLRIEAQGKYMQTILQKASQMLGSDQSVASSGSYKDIINSQQVLEMKDFVGSPTTFPSFQDLNIYGLADQLDNMTQVDRSSSHHLKGFLQANSSHEEDHVHQIVPSIIESGNVDIDSIGDIYEPKPLLGGENVGDRKFEVSSGKLERSSPRRVPPTMKSSAGNSNQGRNNSPYG